MPEHYPITVDKDVYDRIKSEAEPFIDDPNSVLRRLLGLDGDTTSQSTTARQRKPSLAALLAAGLLKPGDKLTWYRRNLGDTHTATVTDEGRMRLDEDGTVCDSPSGACYAAASVSANGWDVWYTADKRSLATLRAQV